MMGISEKTDIRTVQHIIAEAKALGLRVVHRPEHAKNNVVSLEQRRMMLENTKHEVA